jgi:hypothetical protein
MNTRRSEALTKIFMHRARVPHHRNDDQILIFLHLFVCIEKNKNAVEAQKVDSAS